MLIARECQAWAHVSCFFTQLAILRALRLGMEACAAQSHTPQCSVQQRAFRKDLRVFIYIFVTQASL